MHAYSATVQSHVWLHAGTAVGAIGGSMRVVARNAILNACLSEQCCVEQSCKSDEESILHDLMRKSGTVLVDVDEGLWTACAYIINCYFALICKCMHAKDKDSHVKYPRRPLNGKPPLVPSHPYQIFHSAMPSTMDSESGLYSIAMKDICTLQRLQRSRFPD